MLDMTRTIIELQQDSPALWQLLLLTAKVSLLLCMAPRFSRSFDRPGPSGPGRHAALNRARRAPGRLNASGVLASY
jgi:hypothetical protein